MANLIKIATSSGANKSKVTFSGRVKKERYTQTAAHNSSGAYTRLITTILSEHQVLRLHFESHYCINIVLREPA